MSQLPKDRLLTLRQEIEQQRNTIDSLKREGHDCPDAELQLQKMLIELHRAEKQSLSNDASSVRQSSH